MKWLAKQAALYGPQGPRNEVGQRYVMKLMYALAFVILFIASPLPQAFAQGFNFLNVLLLGHVLSGTSSPPTVTNATLNSGATDTAGIVSSNGTASPVLTFGVAFNATPACVIASVSEQEGLGPIVTPTGITFNNLVNGAKASYLCFGTAAN